MIFQLVASNVTIYQTAQNDNLKDILSVDRFGRYLQWSGQDELRAYELYALNTQLSESLYTPLQMLEIALRNSIHRVLTASYSEYWFDNSQVISNSRQQADIQNVKQTLRRNNLNQNPADIIASLTFGFWGTMLNRNYESLWRSDLHKIAIKDNGRRFARRNLADPISRIRKLRNRIAHHEPIIHWNLPRYHEEILNVTRWLSPAAENWSRYHSRFDGLYPDSQIELN